MARARKGHLWLLDDAVVARPAVVKHVCSACSLQVILLGTGFFAVHEDVHLSWCCATVAKIVSVVCIVKAAYFYICARGRCWIRWEC